MKLFKIAVIFLALGFAGCGGGGSSSSSDPLIANFLFTFTISTSTFDDRVTMDEKTSDTTSEGNPFYRGYNADSPSRTAVGAWYNSIDSYIILLETGTADMYWSFNFTIADDGTLDGTFSIFNDGSLGSAYALHSPSYRYEAGKWSSFVDYGRDKNSMLRMLEAQGAEQIYAPALIAATQDLMQNIR